MSTTSASDAFVPRPFAGMPAERDLVAMRQLIPAATMDVVTTAEYGSRRVVLATLLPLLWPAVTRSDGTVLLGVQSRLPGGDLSRALGAALVQALAAEPGTSITQVALTDTSPRLQDVLDADSEMELIIHDEFDFWIDPSAERTPDVEAALARANEALTPTAAVPGLDHGFWVDAGAKEHVRWVLDAEEDRVIDAITRLHARRESAIIPSSRYVGSFRAEGMTIPVWDLPKGCGVEGLEAGIPAFTERFAEALGTTAPLTALERRARGGIVSRQVSLR